MKPCKSTTADEESIPTMDDISVFHQNGWQYGGGIISVRKSETGQHYLSLDWGNDTDYYVLEEGDSLEAKDYREYMIHQDDAEDEEVERITWGLSDPDDYVIAKDYTGKCKILVEQHWNSHTSWQIEEEVFEDKDEAQQWIDRQDDTIYYLSHNESGRPDYYIIAA